MNDKKKEIIAQLITLLILLMIVGLCCLTSCKSYEYTNNPGSETMYNEEFIYNRVQLDSATHSDNIPCDLLDWVSSSYIDYETNMPITQYFYYKLNKNNEVTDIYSVKINIIYDEQYNEIYYNKLRNDTLYIYNKSHISKY